MADAQISVAGTAAVPVSYTVPNAVEEALLCVNATIDGSGASGQFYATVEIVSDGGIVVARCPCFTAIAPGGAAEISWFRVRNALTTAAPDSPYEAVILSRPNLRIYWKLDELGGTTAFDSSGNGITGGYSSTGMSIGVAGLADGTAFQFSNSGAFGPNHDGSPRSAVLHASTSFPPQNGNNVSMEVWVKTTQSPATTPHIVYFGALAGFVEPIGRIIIGTGGKALWRLRDNTNVDHDLLSATAINDGVRHQIGVTYDGATQAIYVDGALSNSAAVAFTVDQIAAINTGTFNVNGQTSSTDNWDFGYTGVVDEVTYYTGVLTASDFAASWAARQ